MSLLESQVEKRFCQRVKERLGGQAYKFTSPSRRSVPDRLVCLPGGKTTFVELKAPGGKPTESQTREHERLRGLGFEVDVLDSYEAIDRWIAEREI